MKKLSLLVLTFLLCAGFTQAQDIDEAELEAFIQAYKAAKASQASAQKQKVADLSNELAKSEAQYDKNNQINKY